MKTVFTVSEVARILRALEGRFGLTARGIRYYARTGMVVPTGRAVASKTSRAARLYMVTDIALLRLVCRLHRQKVHERALWGLLVYRGDELRQLLSTGSGEIVVSDRAALGVGSEDAATPKPICVRVASLMNGLEARLAAYRTRRPNVWTGLKWVRAAEVAKELRA